MRNASEGAYRKAITGLTSDLKRFTPDEDPQWRPVSHVRPLLSVQRSLAQIKREFEYCHDVDYRGSDCRVHATNAIASNGIRATREFRDNRNGPRLQFVFGVINAFMYCGAQR